MLFKKLIALTIAYSFMLQLGSQFGVWVNYITNVDVALIQCENKNIKEIHCYGNCVLVKDLKALEKHESKDNNIQLKGKDIQLFSPISVIFSYFIPVATLNILPELTEHYFKNFFLSIFHPPD